MFWYWSLTRNGYSTTFYCCGSIYFSQSYSYSVFTLKANHANEKLFSFVSFPETEDTKVFILEPYYVWVVEYNHKWFYRVVYILSDNFYSTGCIFYRTTIKKSKMDQKTLFRYFSYIFLVFITTLSKVTDMWFNM